MDQIEHLGDEAADLADTLDHVGTMTAAFRSRITELGGAVDRTTKDLARLDTGFSRDLKSAIDGAVYNGDRFSDVLRNMAASMSQTIYNAAMKPVTDHIGGLFAGAVNGIIGAASPFANGAPFSEGRVMPFAKGGVVSSPTTFPMRGGTGLMGEAGPEAIMPLTRTPDGRLGVAAQGGGRAVHVTMNISTPDVDGFRRSQSQIAAQMSRVLGQGTRNR